MTLTAIDATPALVIIDPQKGLMGIDAAHPVSDIVQRSARLAAAFRRRGFPVVLVNADGRAPGRTDEASAGGGGRAPAPGWTEIVDELAPAPSDLRVTKRTWGAFHGTSLDAQLQSSGVTQIVLTGIATSAGVESTARSAHEHGYNVVLVTDAMTDRQLDVHRHSVDRIFPRLGETASTEEILAGLEAAGTRSDQGR